MPQPINTPSNVITASANFSGSLADSTTFNTNALTSTFTNISVGVSVTSIPTTGLIYPRGNN